MTKPNTVEPETLAAAQAFAERVRQDFPSARIVLYGSRVRGDHQPDSDVDIAVVLPGTRRNRMDLIKGMSDHAVDVLMATDLFVSPYPMWQDEWDDPELVFNPWLIRNIKAEGIAL